jgi:hypothetical protein
MVCLKNKTLREQLAAPVVSALLLLISSCVNAEQVMPGQAFEQAEALFRQDPRWLGADGAHSIRLDNERILWTFADTFIATSETHNRKQSKMVRNTIAIQTGNDPLTASMAFHWRQTADGSAGSFFPEDGVFWYWPQASMLLDEGPLITFLYRIEGTPGQGLGFATTGYALAVIENPAAPVETWEPVIINSRPGMVNAFPATALVQVDEFIIGVALRGDDTLEGVLVRFRSDSLAAGNITKPEWWAGDAAGWLRENELGAQGPKTVFDHAGSECSIHRDQRTGSFVHITTYGFGAATIGLRTAAVLTGPWSDPVTVYRPPESDGPRPFIYGAVAHPELIGPSPGDLIITYANNSFEFGDLLTEYGSKHVYWPRVLTVRVDARH